MAEENYSVPNILIVDDVNANLVVLSEMIKNAGYIARPVTSAKQAWAAIEALRPHLILLDISMPEMDGFEFCSLLKQIAKTRDIPIIFISALNSTEDKIKGFHLGAVDYISKPFEVEEVTLRINTHLKIYKMQLELEIYNKKLYKIINDQIRKIYEEQKNIIYALVKLSEAKELKKEFHLERVGKNSKLLATSMQLSPIFQNEITNSFIDSIELAAPLHDIGKIAITDHILLKPGKLNEEEREIMKTHTEIGGKTLNEIYSINQHNEYLKMAIDIAMCHHEKWDGTGYPKGLKGKEIPLSARIVSVINEYDTLMHERCYRPAYSHDEGMAIMEDKCGKSFDPDIMAIFYKIINHIKED
ncbi:MAG: response regulator receiver modulated metal dependent phosphohydrolase [Herbinix sp.]|jgi:putative two-component system response regulator|nr:response regulator receiver modulated metal dependent phosphohydrolase [Herbinix sp.]